MSFIVSSLSKPFLTGTGTLRERRACLNLFQWMIYHQPINPYFYHGFHECVELHRLEHVTICSKLICRLYIGVFGGGCHDHHWDCLCAFIGFNFLQNFQPINARELQIEQYYFGYFVDFAPAKFAAPKR